MKLLRILLFPFAVLYGIITGIRNLMFDTRLLKSYTFPLPVIAVGNLSTGGTGKTPQIEYLIRLLSGQYRLATLSRGYKRKSKGFILADTNANADIVGDEPYQFFKKFPQIKVAVDADRKNGIEQLLSIPEKPEVILLDDAYQHRRVKAGFYILLTAYDDIYAQDFMLPTGNLRESRSGAKRADIVIVTKCPPDLTRQERQKIEMKLKLTHHQKVFFTFIKYDDKIYSEARSLDMKDVLLMEKILIAGIAKPQPFFDFLNRADDQCMTFPDHHNFTDKDIEVILTKSKDAIIVTTEKDYMRLSGKLPEGKLYYLPMKSAFIAEGDDFNTKILNYVVRSTGISPVY